MQRKTIFILGGLLIVIIIGIILVFDYAIAPVKTDKDRSLLSTDVNVDDANNTLEKNEKTNNNMATSTNKELTGATATNNINKNDSSGLSNPGSSSASVKSE